MLSKKPVIPSPVILPYILQLNIIYKWTLLRGTQTHVIFSPRLEGQTTAAGQLVN